MVFNIASAGLIWNDYLKNSTHVQVTHTEYSLAITEISLISFTWLLFIICLPKIKTNFIFLICVLTNQAFNVAFGSYLIKYHENQDFLPMFVINMALAIIIINSIFLSISCCSLLCFKPSMNK